MSEGAPVERPVAATAVAYVGSFAAALSTSLVAVALPTVARDLGRSAQAVGWVLTAYLLTVSVTLPVAGRIVDRFAARTVAAVGFATFAAGALGAAYAPAFPWLLAARVAQGVGGALLMANGPALITRAVPAARRARTLGTQLAVTYAALSLGPPLGGLLADHASWRTVFVVVAGAGAAGAMVALVLLPRAPPSRSSSTPAARPDVVGAVLLMLLLTASFGGFREVLPGAALLPLGLLLAAAFVAVEARHPSPVVPLALFRAPPFAVAALSSVGLYALVFVLSTLLPFELQHERGMTAAAAGRLMMIQPIVMGVLAPGAGALADRFGARRFVLAGMVAAAVGLALVGVSVPVGLALVGVGAGLFVAPNTASLMAAAPADRQGLAAATAATARNVGMATGVALGATLAEAWGFQGALWIAAALAVLLAAASLAASSGLTRRTSRT